MGRVLIIGATSAIAQATSRLLAADEDSFFLVGRDQRRLDAVADDLTVRGAAMVRTRLMDVTNYIDHEVVIQEAIEELAGLDVVLVAHGTLPDQKSCEASFERTRQEFETNFMSTISLLTHLANYFEQQKHGTIAVISSVAGDRGRQSNYVYGTAKGAVTTFLQGLRNRLHKSGVHVLTIKPGLIDSPMTANFRKGRIWAQPQAVAKCIHKAIRLRHHTVYSPTFWAVIMKVIQVIPENLFKRLSL